MSAHEALLDRMTVLSHGYFHDANARHVRGGTQVHKYAIVPTDAPAAYWDGWWERIDSIGSHVILRSLRKGRDADTDAEVLQGRLLSGLHTCSIIPPLRGDYA